MIDIVHTIGTHIPRWVARYYPDVLWRIPAHEQVAYLTFDDGPTPDGAPQLLDVLARHDTHASFFLLGCRAERRPDLVRALAEAGHTIGNHTYTHPNAWRISEATLLGELDRTTRLLESITRQPVRWMRPPYGYFTQAMRAWCRVRRQRLTMWDVGSGDFLPNATQTQIEQRLVRSIRPGSIIVLHDNPNANRITPAALDAVLTRLRGEGWRFAAL